MGGQAWSNIVDQNPGVVEHMKVVPLKGEYLDGDKLTPSEPPNYGFKGQRQIREPPLTEAEMRSFMIPEEFQDYCAHKFVKFHTCARDKFPWIAGCAHERHEWQMCEYDDYVLRRKEYERERRLRERRKRLEAQSG